MGVDRGADGEVAEQTVSIPAKVMLLWMRICEIWGVGTALVSFGRVMKIEPARRDRWLGSRKRQGNAGVVMQCRTRLGLQEGRIASCSCGGRGGEIVSIMVE